MSDLIRREDVLDAIELTDLYHQNGNKDMVSGANSDEHQAWYKAEDIYKAIEVVPTVDIYKIIDDVSTVGKIGEINIDVQRLAEIASKYNVKIDFEVKGDGGCEVWIEPRRER